MSIGDATHLKTNQPKRSASETITPHVGKWPIKSSAPPHRRARDPNLKCDSAAFLRSAFIATPQSSPAPAPRQSCLLQNKHTIRTHPLLAHLPHHPLLAHPHFICGSVTTSLIDDRMRFYCLSALGA